MPEKPYDADPALPSPPDAVLGRVIPRPNLRALCGALAVRAGGRGVARLLEPPTAVRAGCALRAQALDLRVVAGGRPRRQEAAGACRSPKIWPEANHAGLYVELVTWKRSGRPLRPTYDGADPQPAGGAEGNAPREGDLQRLVLMWHGHRTVLCALTAIRLMKLVGKSMLMQLRLSCMPRGQCLAVVVAVAVGGWIWRKQDLRVKRTVGSNVPPMDLN